MKIAKLKPFINLKSHPIVDLVRHNSNKSIKEIEELIFNYMQAIDEQFPHYKNIRFLQENTKDGKILFSLFGDIESSDGIEEDPERDRTKKLWKKRDGNFIEISKMDDDYLKNAINFAKRQLEKVTKASEISSLTQSIKDLEEEYNHRNSELLKMLKS